jgi:hypothetical protein
MDEVESLLLEGGGPLFHQVAFNLYPDRPAETTGVAAFHEAPDGSPGPALPAIPEGGLSFASEDDFLAALGVPLDQAVAIFRILFRAVFVDHPAAARGLGLEGAGRLYEHAARAGGIHFNPEKWRADPEGRVSLANLGRDFHFPCHHAPTEGRVSVIRLTETSDRLLVSEPFTMEVNDYLDRWYDRPVGCRRFIQAGLVGGAIILVLLLILFLTRR